MIGIVFSEPDIPKCLLLKNLQTSERHHELNVILKQAAIYRLTTLINRNLYDVFSKQMHILWHSQNYRFSR